ncbi:MAG: DUF433 domain-containing protein [Planctomycetes bacterium]|nr:DUF433 domain-containing protein [Planctomycetota bacterium]
MIPNNQIVQTDPDILAGTPVFAETRVPVQILLDYLQAGERLDDFLQDFPTVQREQAVAILEMAREAVTAHAHPS